jgi:hypothetical protein
LSWRFDERVKETLHHVVTYQPKTTAMKKLLILSCFAAGVIAFCAFNQVENSRLSNYEDSIETDKAKHVAVVMEMIKGKEKLPVDSVFKNLKVFKGMPAENLLRIMDKGWSRALGVSCGHCHNTTNWESDEKAQKDITRAMTKMNGRINNELLKEIQGLKSPNPIINCTTCHRGQIKPALNLEAK